VTVWLLRRVAAAVAIVFAVVTLTFILIHLAPGTPFLPGPERAFDPAAAARLATQFGLNRPLPVQYARYLGQLLHGNLGDSFSQHRPVSEALAEAVPNTLVLAGSALLLDFAVGITLGVYLAARARRASAAAVDQVTLFFYSLPTFWLGMVLLLVFSVWLRWLPAGGVTDSVVYPSLGAWGRIGDRLWHLVLPAAPLGLVGAAGTARFQRAALLEVLHGDFIRTARAKGLRERRVLLVHALRNALLPVITLFGLALPFLLTGAVLIETVFSWPGLGKLAVDAIFARDYPLVVAAAILASATVAGGSLVADLLYAAADPRIRVGDA
jgi:peptide/nickel transport system permease protein